MWKWRPPPHLPPQKVCFFINFLFTSIQNSSMSCFFFLSFFLFSRPAGKPVASKAVVSVPQKSIQQKEKHRVVAEDEEDEEKSKKVCLFLPHLPPPPILILILVVVAAAVAAAVFHHHPGASHDDKQAEGREALLRGCQREEQEQEQGSPWPAKAKQKVILTPPQCKRIIIKKNKIK